VSLSTLPSCDGGSNATIRNSSRRSGWDILKDGVGAASTITPPFALRRTDSCSPSERRFPLRRSCHALPALCLTRRLPAQRIRHCGLNATFRTRLQRCDGDWWPLWQRRSRVAHAALLATDTPICDTVRLVGLAGNDSAVACEACYRLGQPDHVATLAERRRSNSSHCLRVSAQNRNVLCRSRSLLGNR
jgi:hypothetical protein